MNFFISASDICNFEPIVTATDIFPMQPVLELIKSKFPYAPITGNIILKLEKPFVTIKCSPIPEKNGFVYCIEKDKNV